MQDSNTKNGIEDEWVLESNLRYVDLPQPVGLWSIREVEAGACYPMVQKRNFLKIEAC
jgi:hypothetical protein